MLGLGFGENGEREGGRKRNHWKNERKTQSPWLQAQTHGSDGSGSSWRSRSVGLIQIHQDLNQTARKGGSRPGFGSTRPSAYIKGQKARILSFSSFFFFLFSPPFGFIGNPNPSSLESTQKRKNLGLICSCCYFKQESIGRNWFQPLNQRESWVLPLYVWTVRFLAFFLLKTLQTYEDLLRFTFVVNSGANLWFSKRFFVLGFTPWIERFNLLRIHVVLAFVVTCEELEMRLECYLGFYSEIRTVSLILGFGSSLVSLLRSSLIQRREILRFFPFLLLWSNTVIALAACYPRWRARVRIAVALGSMMKILVNLWELAWNPYEFASVSILCVRFNGEIEAFLWNCSGLVLILS